MKKYFMILLFVFLIGGVCLAAESEENHFIVVSPHAYAWNWESPSPYVPGRTILGTSMSTYLSLNPGPLTINLGVYGDYQSGDETFLSNIRPILSVAYSLEDLLIFRLGTLDNSDNYGILDAYKSELHMFERPIDYGTQIEMKTEGAKEENPTKGLDFQTFVVWNLLDTPEHRENLDWGMVMNMYIPHFIFNGQLYWTHHGGEIYYAGPLIDYWNYAFGVDHYYDIDNDVVKRFGVKFDWLRNEFQEYHVLVSNFGKGAQGEVYVDLRKIRLYVAYWKSFSEVLTEEGNQLYRHEDWLRCGYDIKTEIVEGFYFRSWAKVHYVFDDQKIGIEAMFGIQGELDFPILNGMM